jgi:AcrR family transcriptional regulator
LFAVVKGYRMTEAEVWAPRDGSPEPASRRERVRAAAYDEIRSVGRQLLATEGLDGVSLRAIAREMGMTAPALYRYYESREHLLADMCAMFFNELSDMIQAACDAEADDDIAGQLMVASRAFRRWSYEHPAEFTHLFGSPIPGVFGPDTYTPEGFDPDNPAHAAGIKFGAIFMRLFVALWHTEPFPVPTDEEIAPALRQQLDWNLPGAEEIPPGARLHFLSAWVSLYGLVTMEVFGHLGWALKDSAPFFEYELEQLCTKLGIAYTPPTEDP